MKFDTLEYLRKTGNNVTTGLYFSCNDYDFLIRNDFDEITINDNKTSYINGQSLREELTKDEIVDRIIELYDMTIMDHNMNLEWIMEKIIIPELRERTINLVLSEQ